MKTLKGVLRPERLRRVPEQFSWVDQRLVQRHLIDRCDARAAALYLFLVTVSDAQGMSYYGALTLTQRLHLDAAELDLARQQLIKLDLIAYQAPLYQVLALPGVPGHANLAPRAPRAPGVPGVPNRAPPPDTHGGPRSLAQIFEQMGHRRDRL